MSTAAACKVTRIPFSNIVQYYRSEQARTEAFSSSEGAETSPLFLSVNTDLLPSSVTEGYIKNFRTLCMTKNLHRVDVW